MRHNPKSSNAGKGVKAGEQAASGFESLSLRTETRAQRGFLIESTHPGQKRGQKAEFVVDALQKVLGNSAKSGKMPPYKMATVYVGPNERHVEFWYWCESDLVYKREKVRIGMRGMDRDTVYKNLCDLRDELNAEFKARNKRFQYHVKAAKAAGLDLSLLEHTQAAAGDASLGKEMRKGFSKLAHNIEAFEKVHTSLRGMTASDLREGLIIDFVEWLQQLKRASKTINDLVWYWDKLAARLRKKKIPVEAISFEDCRVKHIRNETGKYPPLSHEEKLRAFAYFGPRYPSYNLFLFHMYYTCIRPAELHRLKVKDFYILTGKKIHVDWYEAKNGLSNYVQILSPLREELIRMGINTLDPEWYVFSWHCEPGPEQVPEDYDYSGKHWYRHREGMNMPKKKSAYGLKHTFNLDYVENNKGNVDWEWLRRHNRHATKQQTQQYLSSLTAYFLNEDEHVILDYTTDDTKLRPGLKRKKA